MAMQDLMARKVAALVNRAEERDFVDVAVFLADHDIDTLLAMARAVDPAMDDEDVARATVTPQELIRTGLSQPPTSAPRPPWPPPSPTPRPKPWVRGCPPPPKRIYKLNP